MIIDVVTVVEGKAVIVQWEPVHGLRAPDWLSPSDQESAAQLGCAQWMILTRALDREMAAHADAAKVSL